MTLNPKIINIINRDWAAAPRGEKARIVHKWADKLGCHYNTLYRQIETDRDRRTGDRRIDNIESYVQLVSQIKKKPPEQLGEISTEQAIRIAVQNGLLPKSMTSRVSTFDRIIRELGLNKKQRRVQRYQAEYPNQLHHVDASSSKCFYIHRQTADKTDYVLRLHAGTKGYKNKPVPIRLRPWLYGLADDYSGFHVAHYIAAFGESAVDNLEFMEWAWSKNDDTPFFGLPERLKGDLGPMMRGPDAKDFFKRLGVEIDPSTPENKDAHGKIERPWRTVWQRFEKVYFAQTNWKKFEITLSELNRHFLVYQEEYNSRFHRYEKTITRRQAWQKINLRGGAVAIPENALATVASRIERTVGADGCFSLDNVLYEVKGLHDAKVYVYQGVFEDKIVVQDKATGKQYEVEDFKPNPVGTFTAHKHTPHQKAVTATQDLEITNTLYSKAKDSGNVTQLPTRIKKTRELKNHLSTDSYNTVAEAMRDFTAICGFMVDGQDRAAVEAYIVENGLNRNFVKDLAFEVQEKNERSVNYG